MVVQIHLLHKPTLVVLTTLVRDKYRWGYLNVFIISGSHSMQMEIHLWKLE